MNLTAVALLMSLLLGSGVAAEARNPQSSRNAAVSSYNTGVQLFGQQQYAAAAQAFRDAVSLDPSLQQVHGTLGQALYLSGDFQSAVPELAKATTIEPNNAAYWCQLATSAVRVGDTQTAARAFTAYLNLDPNGSYAAEARHALAVMNGANQNTNENYLQDFSRAAHRWAAGTLRVFLASDATPAQAQPTYAALAQWTQISEGKIQFQMVDSPAAAQIVCRWTDDVREFDNSQELGLTTLKFNTAGQIARADVAMLSAAGAGLDAHSARARMQAIALHELGHALGLQHSHAEQDIMFASVAPTGLESAPSARDRNTLLALYR